MTRCIKILRYGLAPFSREGFDRGLRGEAGALSLALPPLRPAKGHLVQDTHRGRLTVPGGAGKQEVAPPRVPVAVAADLRRYLAARRVARRLGKPRLRAGS